MPQTHKITFAGIVQIFEDGPGGEGNSKNERPFVIELSILPGKDDTAKMPAFCLTDAEAQLSLYCNLKDDYDDNPYNNKVYCDITSSIQQGAGYTCNNLDRDHIDSGTEHFELNPGEKVWNIGNRDLSDVTIGHDDNMRYKGWLIHDYVWPDKFDVPFQKNVNNARITIKQIQEIYDGVDHSRTDTSDNNDFMLTWGDRVVDNDVDKCLNGEQVGDTIAVAILSPGRYPFVNGELDWPNVIKGSTNQLFGVVLTQGFEDNTCDKDEPFSGSYFSNIPAVTPGDIHFTDTGKMYSGDDYVKSEITLENLFSTPVPGGAECTN